MYDVTRSGILTTGSDLVFAGGTEGYFQALDARSGTLLWKVNLGGDIVAGPIAYQIDSKEYVAIAAGNGLFVFSLRD
jgi:alcohol dehydrogenase (cytochrome c)